MKSKMIAAAAFAVMMFTTGANVQAKPSCTYKKYRVHGTSSGSNFHSYKSLCKRAYQLAIKRIHQLPGSVSSMNKPSYKKWGGFPKKKYCRASIKVQIKKCTKGQVYRRTIHSTYSGNNLNSYKSLCKKAWANGIKSANRLGQIISKTYKKRTWGGFPKKKYCRYSITVRYRK